MICIYQWFSGKHLSLNYGDITVSATCTTDDSETLEYDIFIEQHEANGVQGGSAEYANVSSANVCNTGVCFLIKFYCIFILLLYITISLLL